MIIRNGFVSNSSSSSFVIISKNTYEGFTAQEAVIDLLIEEFGKDNDLVRKMFENIFSGRDCSANFLTIADKNLTDEEREDIEDDCDYIDYWISGMDGLKKDEKNFLDNLNSGISINMDYDSFGEGLLSLLDYNDENCYVGKNIIVIQN